MTTVEGGALTLESGAMAERVRRLAAQGVSASAWHRHASDGPADYDVIEPGYKFAMTDVAAALGIHQLGRLDQAIERREDIRRGYDYGLSDLPLELEPDVGPGVRHARHLYAVRVREDAPVTRDELIAGLRARGIASSVHFKGLHMLTHYRHRCAASDGDLPHATAYAKTSISLPFHPLLSAEAQERVVDTVAEILQ
jgi:dTDP-4-amino-4,6-dideoxygalactose transaminase